MDDNNGSTYGKPEFLFKIPLTTGFGKIVLKTTMLAKNDSVNMFHLDGSMILWFTNQLKTVAQ